jgi:hypothetical protein
MGWFELAERLRAEWPSVTAARWAIFIGIALGLAVGLGRGKPSKRRNAQLGGIFEKV